MIIERISIVVAIGFLIIGTISVGRRRPELTTVGRTAVDVETTAGTTTAGTGIP